MSRTLWMMKPASAFMASSVQPEPVWSADSDLPRQQMVRGNKRYAQDSDVTSAL